jgi:hypothetical protein
MEMTGFLLLSAKYYRTFAIHRMAVVYCALKLSYRVIGEGMICCGHPDPFISQKDLLQPNGNVSQCFARTY